jgi:hypothetical protein
MDGFGFKESGVYGDMAVGSPSPTISTVENTSTAVLFCPLDGLTKEKEVAISPIQQEASC